MTKIVFLFINFALNIYLFNVVNIVRTALMKGIIEYHIPKMLTKNHKFVAKEILLSAAIYELCLDLLIFRLNLTTLCGLQFRFYFLNSTKKNYQGNLEHIQSKQVIIYQQCPFNTGFPNNKT